MKRSFYVAGVQFRSRQEIDKAMKEIRVGDILTLSPEPSNRYDPNAVQIHYESSLTENCLALFLGYVPRRFSSEVSALLGTGTKLECVVEAIDSGTELWESIKVTIQEVEG